MRTAVKVAAVAGALLLAGAASAQAWRSAVAAGQIGEQSDGYLAVVGGGALAATVADVNIQRKKAYTDKAAAEGATVEAMGIAGGCNQIRRLPAGAKYRLAGGSWLTVGQGALTLDPRCP